MAWHPLGWRAAWLAEIEPFPSAVLAHHYPEVPNLGDMSLLPARIAAGEVEAPDVFCGGTPCQAFSVAGLRRSLDDARGNLSLIFCEIADAIDHARAARGEQPAIVFWENVPGVLSTKDNAFGCFLAGLAGEDDALVAPGGKWSDAGVVLGPQRAVAWRVLDAQYFGLAQRRRRVFVVASAREDFDPVEVLLVEQGVRRDSPPCREAREGVTHDTAPCLTSSGRGVERTGDTRGQDPVVAVAFGGNNQSGPIDVATARNACASASGRMDFETETFLVQQTPTQDPISGTDGTTHALGCGSSGGQASVAVAIQDVRGTDKAQNGRGWNDDGTAYTLDTHATQGVAHSECEALYNKGFITLKEGNASTQETYPGTLLRTLLQEVGEEAFAKWGLGILDSLQSPEILRQALHGFSIRPAAFSRSWVVYCALSRQEDGSGWLLQSLREAECERCSSPGWEPPEQLARELGAYLSELSRPGAQAARFLHDLWQASQGLWILRQALSAIQEMGRSAGGQGQSILGSSEGRGEESDENVLSSGMQCQVSRERVLHETCAAGEARDSREGTTKQERSGKGWVGETPFAVRRLTVEECEFLQGFPRGYSKIPWRGKPADQCPDGPRYKALGNSWAVPVVRWIGARINDQMLLA